MNAKWLGDSYDIVKRFFVQVLQSVGYQVFIDPMFTGTWSSTAADRFEQLIGAWPVGPKRESPAALLIDPDTGIGASTTATHVGFESIASRTLEYDVVVVFDQAFSRANGGRTALQAKLRRFHELGVAAFYYDSHARFLFCGRSIQPLRNIHAELVNVGLPDERIVWHEETD